MNRLILLSYLIESLCFSWFLFQMIGFQHDKKYMIGSITLQWSTLVIGHSIGMSEAFMRNLVVVIQLCFVLYEKGKITFKDIRIIVGYQIFMILTTILGLVVEGGIEGIEIISAYDVAYQYWLSILFSKIMLVIGTCLFLYCRKQLLTSLDIKQWAFLFVYPMIILIVLVYVMNAIIHHMMNVLILQMISIFLIVLFVFYFVVLYRFIQLDQQHIEILKTKQSSEFIKQQRYAISQIRDEIEVKEHRFFYVLFQIEESLKKQDYEQIHNTIQEYRELLEKRKIVIETKNELFDNMLSLAINDLILKGIDVNMGVFISANPFYNQLDFINKCIQLLTCFQQCSHIKIIFTEKNNYLTLSIIYNGVVDAYDIQECFMLFDSYCALYKHDKLCHEIKLVFSLQK